MAIPLLRTTQQKKTGVRCSVSHATWPHILRLFDPFGTNALQKQNKEYDRIERLLQRVHTRVIIIKLLLLLKPNRLVLAFIIGSHFHGRLQKEHRETEFQMSSCCACLAQPRIYSISEPSAIWADPQYIVRAMAHSSLFSTITSSPSEFRRGFKVNRALKRKSPQKHLGVATYNSLQT